MDGGVCQNVVEAHAIGYLCVKKIFLSFFFFFKQKTAYEITR